MIFNNLRSLTSFRSINEILRNYSSRNFQPSAISEEETLYLRKLQRQLKRLTGQTTKYTPSQIHIQVIGPGTRGGCRSVLLVTDQVNYLFNCGEGTERLANENKKIISKVEHIFVTKPIWENIGGIPSVALTVQNLGIPSLYIHGPDGSADLLDGTKNFLTLNELSILAVDTTKEFIDQTMNVTYIPILNPKPAAPAGDGDSINSNFSFEKINYYNYEVNSNGKKSLSLNSFMKSQIDSTMAFVCKIREKEESLDFEKCVTAGVTPGPALKKLKSGEDITLEDGRIVKRIDVISPSEPGPLFIVLECPSEDWIDVIVDHPAFQKYQLKTATDKNHVARCIVHFSPEKVLQNSRYKEWMCKFGPKTHHLIVNENTTGYTSEARHKMQHQLHLLHPNIFPFFGGQQTFIKESQNENISSSNKPIIHQCKTLNTFHLRPDTGFDAQKEIRIYPNKYVKKVFSTNGFLNRHADLQNKLIATTNKLGKKEEYPKLLMLGTGACVSNEYRNNSGILLQLDEDRSIVLDCGEGTMGQLLTFFGKSKIDHVLKSIKAVYISHLHADHHLGFIGLIKQRKLVTDEPLFLLAPQHISSYLYFYHKRFEAIIKHFRIVSNEELLINQCTLDATRAKEIYDLLGIDKISTCYVRHCPYSYGVAITLKDGRKICYSGDTMPSENIVKLASDSFLLIHEATLEDGLEHRAMLKKHSTISQAINIGLMANVQFTLLTHFSHQYKVPLLFTAKKRGLDISHVGITYDFMSISLSELPLVPYFYRCLLLMFSEHRTFLVPNKRIVRVNRFLEEACQERLKLNSK